MSKSEGDTLSEGDIIQITDESDKWFPCLLVVSEVKDWGVQGYVSIPQKEGNPPSSAYYRIQHGKFQKVGTAVYVSE